MINNIEENNVDSLQLYKYIEAIKSNWKKILILSVITTLASILFVLSITPRYTATANLLVEVSNNQPITLEKVVGLDSDKKEYFLTQAEILKSNKIAQRIIDKYDLLDSPEFNLSLRKPNYIKSLLGKIPVISQFIPKKEPVEKSIENQLVLQEFKRRLEVTLIRNTQILQLKFESENPDMAKDIVNELGNAYIEELYNAKLESTEYTTGWFSSRLSQLRSQLKDSEKALSDYLVKEKLIDDSGIQTLASQELTNLTEQLADTREKRIQLESAYNSIKSNSNVDIATLSSIPVISQHPQIVAIRQAQIQALNEVKELSKRYGPKHDKMIAAQARLKSIEDQARSTINDQIGALRKELLAAKSQENLISDEAAKLKENYQELSIKKNTYDSLKREVETNRDLLSTFLAKQKETTATSDFKTINARFTDIALKPLNPSYPKRKLVVLAVFFVSLFFFSIITITVSFIKDTVIDAKSLENSLGMSPLVVIPHEKKVKNNKLLIDKVGESNRVLYTESFKSLRTYLSLLNNKDNKILTISSSLPGEGKTTVAINTAVVHSQLEKVLLIDCDMRNPSVGDYLIGQKYKQGLSNYLLGMTELDSTIEKSLINDNLDIIYSGMHINNSLELIESTRFKELLEDAKSKYDKIILDTPPLNPVSDAFLLGKYTSELILVVKANKTRRDIIERNISRLATHEIKLKGIILNDVIDNASTSDGYGYYGYVDSTKSTS